MHEHMATSKLEKLSCHMDIVLRAILVAEWGYRLILSQKQSIYCDILMFYTFLLLGCKVFIVFIWGIALRGKCICDG